MKIEDVLFLSKYVRNEKKLKIENSLLYDQIIKHNKRFINIIWSNKLYNYINNIKNPPKCINCGNVVKFQKFSTGYSKYCTNMCHLKSNNTKELRKQTNLSKYGVENAFQSEKFKEKIKQTNLNKFGVENPMTLIETIEKSKKTNLKKYGVENYSQTNEFIKKSKITWLKKYGVNSPAKNDLICEKINNSKKINFVKKWSKILCLSKDNICVLDNNVVLIKNYCKKHDKFEISKTNLINRTNRSSKVCTECYPISENSSIKEIEIRNFIEEELNICTEKIKIENKEIDIYIPSHKLGIEFDGLYWHSGEHKDDGYHLNKTELCEERGIQLIHIFEDEWIGKKEIVKNIIKSKLNIFDREIYVSDCAIKRINHKQSSEFLNQNHIQGSVKTKYNYGLIYNDELVGLMCFSIINDKYEILRFCEKLNTNIIGGANMLLKHFIDIYQPKSISTYVDRRYFNGDLYKQMNFMFINNTKPNYWYFKRGKYVRKQFSNESKEENDLNKNEYLRIFDCGQTKFELSLCF